MTTNKRKAGMVVSGAMLTAMTMGLATNSALAAGESAVNDVVYAQLSGDTYINPLLNDKGLFKFDSLRIKNQFGEWSKASDFDNYTFSIEENGPHKGEIVFTPNQGWTGTATIQYEAVSDSNQRVEGTITTYVGVKGEAATQATPGAQTPKAPVVDYTIKDSTKDVTATSQGDELYFHFTKDSNIDPSSFKLMMPGKVDGTVEPRDSYDPDSYTFMVEDLKGERQLIYTPNTGWTGTASVKYVAKTLDGKDVAGTITVNTVARSAVLVGNPLQAAPTPAPSTSTPGTTTPAPGETTTPAPEETTPAPEPSNTADGSVLPDTITHVNDGSPFTLSLVANDTLREGNLVLLNDQGNKVTSLDVEGGTVHLQNGVFTFEPRAGFTGAVGTFKYGRDNLDEQGVASAATVSITLIKPGTVVAPDNGNQQPGTNTGGTQTGGQNGGTQAAKTPLTDDVFNLPVNANVMLDVAANDTAKDGTLVPVDIYEDGTQIPRYKLETVKGASVELKDGKIQFIADKDWKGTVKFAYALLDENGEIMEGRLAHVTVNVGVDGTKSTTANLTTNKETTVAGKKETTVAGKKQTTKQNSTNQKTNENKQAADKTSYNTGVAGQVSPGIWAIGFGSLLGAAALGSAGLRRREVEQER